MSESNTCSLHKETMVLSIFSRVKETLYFTATKISEWSLIFLIVAVPLSLILKQWITGTSQDRICQCTIIIAGFAWFLRL